MSRTDAGILNTLMRSLIFMKKQTNQVVIPYTLVFFSLYGIITVSAG